MGPGQEEKREDCVFGFTDGSDLGLEFPVRQAFPRRILPVTVNRWKKGPTLHKDIRFGLPRP
jgi:hypothetical protein